MLLTLIKRELQWCLNSQQRPSGWLPGRHILSAHCPLIDNQIRPPSSGIPVDDIRLILLSDRRKLLSAPSRPAVFMQERCKVSPSFPFAPGVF